MSNIDIDLDIATVEIFTAEPRREFGGSSIVEAELTAEEWNDYLDVMDLFDEWQIKLRKLYERN